MKDHPTGWTGKSRIREIYAVDGVLNIVNSDRASGLIAKPLFAGKAHEFNGRLVTRRVSLQKCSMC